ncbi:MAG TPA: S53 family peptidase [Thermoplasmata archaeon]|nr:S53 family peptidase [Thermoplasmata archaeon]
MFSALRRRRGTLQVALAAVLAIGALLAGGLTVGVVAASPAPSSYGTATGAPALPPFAERAGDANLPLAGVTSVAPAEGPQSVVITFEPTDLALYEPPPVGAPALTTAEVANAFGLSPAAYSAAEEYFESAGLRVSHAWADRLSLSLVGSGAAVDRAFGTTLLAGAYDGRGVTFPSVAPSLPAGLESEVAAVAGLETGFSTFSLPEVPEPTASSGAVGPAQNPNDLVTPSIARYIYGVSGLYNLTARPTYATGKGIVLLLWGEGYAPSDISTFFSTSYPGNFPQPTVTPYPVDGAPEPSPGAVNDPSNASRELTLDIEWSGSMAPGAQLDPVYAPDGPASDGYSPTDAGMIDALNTAIDTSSVPNVAAISMSFGSADGADPSFQTSYQQDFAVAAQEHISVFAATGDTGGDANGDCTGGPMPEYPAASPNVVAVGGTEVALNRDALGTVDGASESAWSLSGGGFSVDYPAPTWQEVGSAAGPVASNGHRGMPDVAATAGYNFVYFDGNDDAGGGTSFATPLWAGMVTEMDALRTGSPGRSNFGFLDPALYDLGANTSTSHPAYNDITTGGNCLGDASVGWDTATGWGSPIAVNLYEHLVASFVNLPISISPTPVGPGQSVTISVSVTNSSSGAPIAGIPVAIDLTTTGLAGPCSGTFGNATPLTNATGVAVATIAIPGCYLGSSAEANAEVTSHGYYGTNSSSVGVNLLGYFPALAGVASYPGNVVFFVGVMALAIVLGGVLGRRRAPRRTAADPVPAPPPEPTGPGSGSEPPAAGASEIGPSGAVPDAGTEPPGPA